MGIVSKRRSLMFVLGLAPQKIGGIEKFLRRLVIALDAAGWNSILCFEGIASDEFRDYVGFPYVTVELLDHQGGLGLSCAGELWRLLRRHRPEIFVYAFHGAMRCFPWLAKLAGCRRVFFNDHSSRPPGQVAAPLRLSRRVLGKLLTAPLDAIFSVSDFTRRTGDALGLTSAPNMVVPNGVEVRTLDPALRTAFRERYGIQPDAIVVTQVCWMVDVKGVDVMLEAAGMLLPRHANVHFLFVGDGPELPHYRQRALTLGIEKAVTFTGMLNNPTGMGVFDASDLYCQASVWQEASGLAVLEAMSLKLPVIASDTGGLPELVQAGVSGLLVPVKNSVRLLAALETLIEDVSLRRSFGEAAYGNVIAKHRIEDTVTRYVQLFLSKDSA